MKPLRLAALGAAACALLVLAPAAAPAQVASVSGVLPPPITGPGSGSLYPTPIPPQTGVRDTGMRGFHRGFHRNNGGLIVIEDREYVPVVQEVVEEKPAPPPAPLPPPEPRKPYVVGRSYSSLPGGCMKLIQDGSSYYYCDGGWYRQLGAGRAAQYKAVGRP